MWRTLVVAAIAVAALAAAGAGSAGRDQITLTCNGEPLAVTVTSTTNDHSVAWGVATISAGSHLIPVAFSFTVTDLTTNTLLDTFAQSKGNGNGLHNSSPVTCTTPPETTTAGEIGIPGLDPDDIIQIQFSAQAVWKS